MEAFTASDAAEIAFDASCIALVSTLLPSISFCAASIAWESASRVELSATCQAELSSNVRAPETLCPKASRI